ncbi:hypothetical protein KAU08_08435 [bacterium]|nr:hypothetical protein [bacterium]
MCIRATPGATANSGIFTVAVAHALLALIEGSEPGAGCRQHATFGFQPDKLVGASSQNHPGTVDKHVRPGDF